MTITTPTTELEAVNAMLAAIGESPINSLTQPGLVDAVIATTILGQVSREVQSRAWAFNSESEYPLARDVDGNVYVPTNALRVSIANSMASRYDVVQRGRRLYDRENHTFVFTETLKVNLVSLLTFEDMPECARWYVTCRAARQFLDKMVGTAELHSFTQADEQAALAVLKEFEGETNDYNVLTGSYDVFRTIDRGPGAGDLVNPALL
jgi:hypothetical protein